MKPSDADRLSTATDSFSLRVTRDGSMRFFVRSEFARSTEEALVFTDFLLEPNETLAGVAAFQLTCCELGYKTGPEKVEFLDIYPGYSMTGDKGELVRRHDQLVQIVRLWAEQNLLSVSNAHLDQDFDKYTTRVFLV